MFVSNFVFVCLAPPFILSNSMNQLAQQVLLSGLMIMGRLYFMTTQHFAESACLKSGSGSQKLQIVWALILIVAVCVTAARVSS